MPPRRRIYQQMVPLMLAPMRFRGDESVAAGAKLLGLQPFDLVVTDVNLPDGGGLVLADQARAANIKTLVLTGCGLKPGHDDDYVLKPIRLAELTKAIDECLAAKARRP